MRCRRCATRHPTLARITTLQKKSWEKVLRKLQKVSFASIYYHFMEHSLDVGVGLKRDDDKQSNSQSYSSADCDDKVFSKFSKHYSIFLKMAMCNKLDIMI